MTRFPRIQYRIRSDEFRELYEAFLIDDETAIEITEYDELTIFGVTPSDKPGIYLDVTGTISLGTARTEDDVGLVVDRLRSMSAWDLIVRFMTRSRQPFEFDIVNMWVVDPSHSATLDEP